MAWFKMMELENTYVSHRWLQPSHVDSDKCIHWVGLHKCHRDDMDYCHTHLYPPHTPPLKRKLNLSHAVNIWVNYRVVQRHGSLDTSHDNWYTRVPR